MTELQTIELPSEKEAVRAEIARALAGMGFGWAAVPPEPAEPAAPAGPTLAAVEALERAARGLRARLAEEGQVRGMMRRHAKLLRRIQGEGGRPA